MNEITRYRYELRRIFDPNLPKVLFIGCNPSTADEVKDDPTIRRCVRFSKGWGFGCLLVGNLFACRATDPGELRRNPDPVGRDNNSSLLGLADEAEQIILCWGNHGLYQARDQEVLELLKKHTNKFRHLGLTKYGCPRHPLYLPADTPRLPW